MPTEIGPIGPAPAPIPGVKRAEEAGRDKADASTPPRDDAPEAEARDSAPAETQNPSRDVLDELIQGELRPNARLSIDESEGGDIVYRIFDSETGEVYRQWPREELLRVVSYFREVSGLVVDRRI